MSESNASQICRAGLLDDTELINAHRETLKAEIAKMRYQRQREPQPAKMVDRQLPFSSTDIEAG